MYTKTIDTTISQRIIRLPQVKELTGLSRSTIYALMKTYTFPRAISLGPRAVGWVEYEVVAWVATRVTESRSIKNIIEQN